MHSTVTPLVILHLEQFAKAIFAILVYRYTALPLAVAQYFSASGSRYMDVIKNSRKYGSHLWNINSVSTVRLVNAAFQKEIRPEFTCGQESPFFID